MSGYALQNGKVEYFIFASYGIKILWGGCDLFRLKNIETEGKQSLFFLGTCHILDSHIRAKKPIRDFNIETLLSADGRERQSYLIYLHDDVSNTILRPLGHDLGIFGQDTEILAKIYVVFQVEKEDCDKKGTRGNIVSKYINWI